MARGMLIEMPIVYYPPWRTICFRGNMHPRDPTVRGIERNPLKDSKADISLQTIFYTCMPSQGDLGWCSDGCGLGCWVYMES